MLQIGAALFYYNLGQTLLQTDAASLLQTGAIITNWCITVWLISYSFQCRNYF